MAEEHIVNEDAAPSVVSNNPIDASRSGRRDTCCTVPASGSDAIAVQDHKVPAGNRYERFTGYRPPECNSGIVVESKIEQIAQQDIVARSRVQLERWTFGGSSVVARYDDNLDIAR